MPDWAGLPSEIRTKAEFYSTVQEQVASLLQGQRNWITNLSNASSLLFNAYISFDQFFGGGLGAVNWCGFYIDASFFPSTGKAIPNPSEILLLGPFQGKPGCQLIKAIPGKGVCADAFTSRQPILVQDVHSYPGHIACDDETNSEVVIPLIVKGADGKDITVGVFDLDCKAPAGFGKEDLDGLIEFARIVMEATDWAV